MLKYLGRTRYNDDGSERPKISAYLEYDGNGRQSVCHLHITNNGSKTLTLGGSSRIGSVYVYPSGESTGTDYYNYVTGYWCDSNGYKLRSIECDPGESGFANIKLNSPQYFEAGAAVIFYMIYDGWQYIAMVDEYGNVEYE